MLGRETFGRGVRPGRRPAPNGVTVQVSAQLDSLLFGVVPVFASRQIALEIDNEGNEPLTVNPGDVGAPFTITPSGATGDPGDWIVPPGAIKVFFVRYWPMEAGTHLADWALADDPQGRITQLSGLAYSGHQNPLNPFDVNGDGYVTPQDVLLLINEINRGVGVGPLAPRTAEQPGSPLFLDVLGNGQLTPNDVLQVINYTNRGGTEEEPAGESEEVEAELPDGDRALSVHYGWLTAMDAAGSLMPVIMPVPSAVSGPGGDVRVDHLIAAVEDVEFRTTYRQTGMGDWPATWQRWERSRDARLAAATGDDLADWKTLLDDPATDLAELDAYFTALAQ